MAKTAVEESLLGERKCVYHFVDDVGKREKLAATQDAMIYTVQYSRALSDEVLHRADSEMMVLRKKSELKKFGWTEHGPGGGIRKTF